MKNIFYKLSFIFLIVATIAGCEEDKVTFDVDGGSSLYQFTAATSNLLLVPEGTSTSTVEVGVTAKSDVERTIPVIIDATSTATAEQYSIDASSLVIPAGEFTGNIAITGNFDAVPDGVTVTLVLVLDESTGINILDGKSRHTVRIFRSCPTDLAGSYSVTTTYGYHDFLPDFDIYTMDTNITGNPNVPNVYKVADFSGGLYSVGPYAANYQTNAAPAATRDLTFTVSCGNVSWVNESDPWGAIVPTPDGVNTYDEATGVLTISWTCLGYGENGVSVYTKN
jgi:hypothetical protein